MASVIDVFPEVYGWYGVDLDGTLAIYDGWKGEEHIGEPIERMVRLVQQLLWQRQNVRIFTARVSEQGRAGIAVERVRELIEAWVRAAYRSEVASHEPEGFRHDQVVRRPRGAGRGQHRKNHR